MFAPLPLLLYLLKVHAGLLLLAAGYFGLLRRLTFLRINRLYLLVATVFAVAWPALPLPALGPLLAGVPTGWVPLAPAAALAGPAVTAAWPALLLLAYAGGSALLLLRLVVHLLTLRALHRRSQPLPGGPAGCRALPAGVSGPFSFGSTIYLPAGPVAAAVLRHEQAHVQQRHTADVLFFQFLMALAWPNPVAWLLRRAALANLEFLADRAAVGTSRARRAYQLELLRYAILAATRHSAGPGPLVSGFGLLILKRRVAMMNTPASARRALSRYALALLLLALPLGWAACLQAQVAPKAGLAQASMAVFYVDGQLVSPSVAGALDPRAILSVEVLKGAVAQQLFPATPGGAVVITTVARQEVPAVRALNARLASAQLAKE